MKKLILLLLLSVMILCLPACGQHKETIELIYGDTYIIDTTIYNKDDLVFVSDAPNIAETENGIISALAPGETTIKAMSGEKVLGEYLVSVTIVPITNIVLSTNSVALVEEETSSLSYTLFPDNASEYQLTWKSADETVALVDETGTITAIAQGQTSVYITSTEGVMASCTVIVNPKLAYDRLSEKERIFVDVVLKYIDQFKNPDSVVIKGIEYTSGSWTVKVTAQNSFGGNNTTVYYLSESLGFWNWESLDMDMDISISPDSSYDLNLINEAIKEKI